MCAVSSPPTSSSITSAIGSTRSALESMERRYSSTRSACSSRIPSLPGSSTTRGRIPPTRSSPRSGKSKSGLVGAVMRKWDGGDHYEGSIRDEEGRDFLFRLRRFSQGDEYSGYSLFLAAEADFA